jgi:Undecaprenyl-phosphate galactose phosphotransferase WbaP
MELPIQTEGSLMQAELANGSNWAGSAPLLFGVGSLSQQLPLRIARWWSPIARTAILASFDFGALAGCAALGYWLWPGLALGQPMTTYSTAVPLICLLPLGYATAGLYPGFGLGAVETLRRLSLCTSVAFLSFAALVFILKLPNQYSRIGYAVTWGSSLAFVPCVRFAALARLSRLRWWRKPAVLFGSAGWVERTSAALRVSRSLGYRPIAAILTEGRLTARHSRKSLWVIREEDVHILAQRVECEVLIEESAAHSSTASWLYQNFAHVLVIRETGDLPVEGARVRTLGNSLGVEFSNNLLIFRNRLCKRGLDLLIGALAFMAAMPLIGLGALVILAVDGSPVFFAQEREGLRGRRIKVWKLRTMYKDAEARLATVLAADAALRNEWQQHFKLKHDPRLLPCGNFLRRWSFDELPQLWNVLAGDMSLVGPRPFPNYHIQQLPHDLVALRSRVLPGLTGMWQVMVRGRGTLSEQAAFDTYYVRNWSLWLDLYLLARTAIAVVSGDGAY